MLATLISLFLVFLLLITSIIGCKNVASESAVKQQRKSRASHRKVQKSSSRASIPSKRAMESQGAPPMKSTAKTPKNQSASMTITNPDSKPRDSYMSSPAPSKESKSTSVKTENTSVTSTVAAPIQSKENLACYKWDGVRRDEDIELTIFMLPTIEERLTAFKACLKEADEHLVNYGVAFTGEHKVLCTDEVREAISVAPDTPELLKMRLWVLENYSRLYQPKDVYDYINFIRALDLNLSYAYLTRTDLDDAYWIELLRQIYKKVSTILKEETPEEYRKMPPPMPMFARIHDSKPELLKG